MGGIMSRQGIVISALALVGLAPGRAAAETSPAASHWEISAGLAGGLVMLHDDALMKPSSGSVLGLMTRVGYLGQGGVGLVVDASLWTTNFGHCVADGACVDQRADHYGMVTAAVRWQVTPGMYLQGGAGASHTRHSADWGAESWTSPVGTAAVGWRRSIPDGFLDLELHANAFSNDDTLVTQLAATVALGHAW